MSGDIAEKERLVREIALVIWNDGKTKMRECETLAEGIVPIMAEKMREKLLPTIEVAISSLKYCEEKYGHDDMARLNVEAGWQAFSEIWGGKR